MALATIGGRLTDYLPDGANGDLVGILRPIQRGVLEFTGFSVLASQVVYGSVGAANCRRARNS